MKTITELEAERDEKRISADVFRANAERIEAEAKELDRQIDKLQREEKWWKPSDDPIRNLVKVSALIAAEIDRLKRL